MALRLFAMAGHGAGDPGACSDGYSEATIVRAIAERIKELGGDRVVLLDTTRNWFQDRGISSYPWPDDAGIVELHMDSSADTARGAHVIIKAGIGGADDIDRAIAERISAVLPGRASTIVERNDLANPTRAAARGVNYRLVENGFISNDADRAYVLSHIDDIACIYLDAFGIPHDGGASTDVDHEGWSPTPGTPIVEEGQSEIPEPGPIGAALLLDADAGVRTFAEFARQLGLSGSDADGWLNHQYEGNRKYLRNCSSVIYAYDGTPSPTVLAIQRRIGSASLDGIWGAVDTENLRSYMQREWGYLMTSDGWGVFGANTAYNVQHSLNKGFWRNH